MKPLINCQIALFLLIWVELFSSITLPFVVEGVRAFCSFVCVLLVSFSVLGGFVGLGHLTDPRLSGLPSRPGARHSHATASTHRCFHSVDLHGCRGRFYRSL